MLDVFMRKPRVKRVPKEAVVFARDGVAEKEIDYLYYSRSRAEYCLKEEENRLNDLIDRYVSFRNYDAIIQDDEPKVVKDYVKGQLESLPKEIEQSISNVEAYKDYIQEMDDKIMFKEKKIKLKEKKSDDGSGSFRCVKCGRRSKSVSSQNEWYVSGSTRRYICDDCAAEECE